MKVGICSYALMRYILYQQNNILLISLTDPCSGILCGKGSCRVENHQPVCICQPGYTLSNGKCVDIDECADRTSCHISAQCQNTQGSHTCLCPSGHIGDPYKAGCRPKGECTTNLDCSVASACSNGRYGKRCLIFTLERKYYLQQHLCFFVC